MKGMIRKGAWFAISWLIVLKELSNLYSLHTFDISKTANKVFEMLDEVVETVREKNVVQIITDNAANYKSS